MKNYNIVLIGFMGSGKTYTARALSKILKLKVFSTDGLIEKKERMPVVRIFEKKGEKYFRRQEAEVVANLAKKKNVIIDCGGGIVLNPLNIKRLRKSGVLIYLKTSPEWIYKRVKLNKKRPLLQVKNPMAKIKAMLKERGPLYAQADAAVNTDAKTPLQVAQEIVSLFSCSCCAGRKL